MRIALFSGTTEGRELSLQLAGAGYAVTVFVATEYGSEEQGEHAGIEVREGRIDREEMERILPGFSHCIDATHPYASEVTANIKSACNDLNLKYIRVVRNGDESTAEGFPKYATAADCAKALNKTDSNILLTTGSKELATYAENVSKEVFI